MNFFKKIFKKSNDKFIEKATFLIHEAKYFAVGSYIPATDHFGNLLLPNFKNSNFFIKDWDFYITVACMSIATGCLRGIKISNKHGLIILKIIQKSINDWDSDGANAIKDCGQFCGKNLIIFDKLPQYQNDKSFLLSFFLGFWIAANLFKHLPKDDEEIKFARYIGGMVILKFHNWWV